MSARPFAAARSIPSDTKPLKSDPKMDCPVGLGTLKSCNSQCPECRNLSVPPAPADAEKESDR